MQRAAQLPHRRVFFSGAEELSGEISRELVRTAEVVGSALGEDCVAVLLDRSRVMGRDRSEPPLDLDDGAHVG